MKRVQRSAARLVVLENNDPISAEIEAIQRRIRQRAFELSQTRPHDAHERYDWIKAESETIAIPAAELIEKNGQLEVKFAVAGVNPDDVNVMVTPDQVLLKSEHVHQHESESGTVHLCDFSSATIFRSVNLPQTIDVKSVKVEFADGIISVSALKEGAEPEERPKAKRAASGRKAAPKKRKP
jgi:HSP20 family protein